MNVNLIYQGGCVGEDRISNLLKASGLKVVNPAVYDAFNDSVFNIHGFMTPIPNLKQCKEQAKENKKIHDKRFKGVLNCNYGVPALFSDGVNVRLTRNQTSHAAALQYWNDAGDFDSWVETWNRWLDKNFPCEVSIDHAESIFKAYTKLAKVIDLPKRLTKEEVLSV